MPGIIKMIGYFPLDIDMSTFGGWITCYRYRYGMTPKEFGALIPADASTIRNWEKGKHIPTGKKRLRVENVINFRVDK
jgi:DNA-binding transcriptional regulator YiaG